MCGCKYRWEGRLEAAGNSLLMASISPLTAEMRNSFMTREKDGGEGRRLVLEHAVIHLSKLLCPHQMKDREATIGKLVDSTQGHNNHLSFILLITPSCKEMM